ncbi:MAG: hypothetical protein ABIZ70_09805 [Gemmatimonadales bacterium]
MYSTCLFCSNSLGQNEVLESLPVGRRIAFDSAHGRLWVICPGCARWNLVPFDSRLETIDAAERLFHDTRTRFSTDNIGLARLREGLELVRIGPALRPEFAAWRYGARFASRRRRNLLVSGGITVGVLAAYFGARAALGGGALYLHGLTQIPKVWEKRRIRVRHQLESGEQLALTHADISGSWLRYDEERFTLEVPKRIGVTGAWTKARRIHDNVQFEAKEAEVLLTRLLPVISGTSGSASEVRQATEMLEARQTIVALAQGTNPHNWDSLTLGGTNTVARLAIEMASNEQTERRVLEGELSLLERQWAEADRLAKISDALAIPDSVDAELDDLKKGSASSILDDRAP